MTEEKPKINHHFDVWHFSKNIEKQLLADSKTSSCRNNRQMDKIDRKSFLVGVWYM